MDKRIRVSEFIYFAFFLLLFTTRIIGLYEGNIVYSVVLVLGMSFFALGYLLTPGTVLSFLIDFLLLSCAFISWFYSGEKGLLLYFAMMIGARRISLERLFKVALGVSGSAYTVMIILGVFGIITDYQNVISYRPIIGYISRRSISPLQLNILMEPYLVLMIMVLYLVRKKDKMSTLKISVLLLAGLWYLFGYCVTISSLVVGMVLLGLNYYLRFYSKFNKTTLIFAQLSYAMCAIIAIVAPYFDSSEFGTGGTFARRLQIGYYYWHNYSLKMWGQRMDVANQPLMPYGIHQSQLHLLLQCGIVLFIIVNLLHHYSIMNMVSQKKGTELAAALSFAMLGVVEPFLFNLSFKNIVFVFVGKEYGSWLDDVATKMSFLGKRIQIIPDKQFTVRIPILKNVSGGKECLVKDKRYRRRMFVVSIVLGVLVGMIVSTFTPEQSYLYDQNSENSVDGKAYYFSPGEVEKMTEEPVIDYEDEKTPLYKHVSYFPMYDHVRLIISAFVWTTVISILLFSLLYCINPKRIKEENLL
ncbi:hypothetical protein D6855_12500 [Butyrivibrio sp. CB08]|uniref:hypothetical protein n=1 Tax=Butyrivibrio sp. CB08 TaxID=2364879 RepID=UPI000EA8581F|nr:hypothetical protein [Butyrivibrio sp. CB08]RKM57864.1 hypothetical protein D6855_12500 [Butyrivibrio sp. CB08]